MMTPAVILNNYYNYKSHIEGKNAELLYFDNDFYRRAESNASSADFMDDGVYLSIPEKISDGGNALLDLYIDPSCILECSWVAQDIAASSLIEEDRIKKTNAYEEDPTLIYLKPEYVDYFSQHGYRPEKILSANKNNDTEGVRSGRTEKKSLPLKERECAMLNKKSVLDSLQNSIENIINYDKNSWGKYIHIYEKLWLKLIDCDVLEWKNQINCDEMAWLRSADSEKIMYYKEILNNIIKKNFSGNEVLFLINILLHTSQYADVLDIDARVGYWMSSYRYTKTLKAFMVYIFKRVLVNNKKYKYAAHEKISMDKLAKLFSLPVATIRHWIAVEKCNSEISIPYAPIVQKNRSSLRERSLRPLKPLRTIYSNRVHFINQEGASHASHPSNRVYTGLFVPSAQG